jgi:cytochrome b561
MNRFAFVALLLSFTPYVFGSEDDAENNYKKHWAAHGICASIAWAILVPLAICSAMLRKELVKAGFSERFWFQLHRALNLTAAALTIISFALGVFIIRAQDGSAHLKEDPHFLNGTVIFVMAMLQVTFALFRPNLPLKEEKKEAEKNMEEEETVAEAKDVENKAESIDKEAKNAAVGEKTGEESTDNETEVVGKKSKLRLVWEANHRLFGVALLAMAWWQIHSGWELYLEEDFGGQDNGAAFLGVAGGIIGVAVIYKIVQKARAHHA